MTQRLQSSRSHLAVACGPESEIRLVNPDETGVLPITSSNLFQNGEIRYPRNDRRRPINFKKERGRRFASWLALEQQILSWREEIRLSGRKMNWSLTADVKPTELPTFTQTLLLDRQLEIDSATVHENGVERQLRWSVTPSINFSQKRLTIDLNRQPTGTFQLQVAGSLPIRISHATALPVVKFEGSRAGPGTISLFHESAYRLELTGRYAASAELPLSPGTNSETVDWQHFQTLQVAEGETGLLVRLEPAVGRSVARLGLQGTFTGERWTLEGWLRLVPEEATREVRVRIPAWLSEAEFQDEQGAVLARERDGDGQLFLGVACDAAGTPRVLRWRGETSATTESDVSLDLPEVLQATSVETLIALPPDSEWTVDRGTPQTIDALAPELREFFPGEAAAAEMSVYAVPGFRVHLVRTDQLSPDGKSSVLFVEHRLSGRDDGGVGRERPTSIRRLRPGPSS
ncbi:MAG: hypothetical protein U0872_12080 [Planctomycetaceae bacterium]